MNRSVRPGMAPRSDLESVAGTRRPTSMEMGRSVEKDKKMVDATDYYSVATLLVECRAGGVMAVKGSRMWVVLCDG